MCIRDSPYGVQLIIKRDYRTIREIFVKGFLAGKLGIRPSVVRPSKSQHPFIVAVFIKFIQLLRSLFFRICKIKIYGCLLYTSHYILAVAYGLFKTVGHCDGGPHAKACIHCRCRRK